MEQLALDRSGPSDWGTRWVDSLQAQRSRADELLRELDQRARQAEVALDERLRQLVQRSAHRDQQLQQSERQLQERQRQVQQREEQLATELKSLEVTRKQLETLKSTFQQHQDEAAQRQRQLLDQLQSEHLQLDQRRLSLQEQQDGQQQAIEQQRANLEQERTTLRQQREALADDRAALERERAELESTGRSLQQQAKSLDAAQIELDRQRSDRDSLAGRLVDVQDQNRQAGISEELNTELAGLREDLERAEREIASLRARNADLLKQLEPLRQAGASHGLDWEAQKQRLLAQLESDFVDEHSGQAEDRLTIEGAIRITDEVIAERDCLLAERDEEIADLRRQLERLSRHDSDSDADHDLTPATSSADQDDSVRDQRAKLHRMQQAFQNKLRQAEIEISVERAKLARERSDLENKVQMLVSRFGDLEPSPHEPPAKRAGRGHWLSRLGLATHEPPTA